MAQHSHVPKFGNWDRENVPYTAYFDNARKEKGTGMKKMNPNDPEENPDAFTSAMMGYEIEDSHHARRALPSQFTSDKKMPKHNEDLLNGEEGVIQKINFTQERSRNRKSSKSGSSSDISSSDRSLLQANQHRVRSNQKKNLGEGANNFQTPSPPAQVKTGNQQADEIQHQRVASVPKFGAWDETDPTSGEGFTIIFNKVKQEKHIGSSKPHPGHPGTTMYSNGQRNHGSSSSRSKCCCCLF